MSRAEGNGKLAVITGGGHGIGRAITLRLARSGWNCLIAGLDCEDLEDTARAVECEGRSLFFLKCDVSIDEVRRVLTQRAEEAAEPLGLVVNSAAHSTAMPLFDQSPDTWQAELDTNVTAVALLSSWAIERMRPLREGAGINIGAILMSFRDGLIPRVVIYEDLSDWNIAYQDMRGR